MCVVDNLAHYIALIKVEPFSLDESLLQQTKAQLTHTDLPVLTDADFIDYDRRSRAVRYADPPSLLETTLEITLKIDAPEGLD